MVTHVLNAFILDRISYGVALRNYNLKYNLNQKVN